MLLVANSTAVEWQLDMGIYIYVLLLPGEQVLHLSTWVNGSGARQLQAAVLAAEARISSRGTLLRPWHFGLLLLLDLPDRRRASC